MTPWLVARGSWLENNSGLGTRDSGLDKKPGRGARSEGGVNENIITIFCILYSKFYIPILTSVS